MTTNPATTLPQQLFKGGTIRKNLEFNWKLAFVAALYLAVAVVELSIIILAAPSITEIGRLYVTVP
jgi:hypothetical protein